VTILSSIASSQSSKDFFGTLFRPNIDRESDTTERGKDVLNHPEVFRPDVIEVWQVGTALQHIRVLRPKMTLILGRIFPVRPGLTKPALGIEPRFKLRLSLL
jgi:hypothetical protein